MTDLNALLDDVVAVVRESGTIVAAGWLLVREAGGFVTRTDGSPFALHAHDILATNGKIHEALRGLMYGEEG